MSDDKRSYLLASHAAGARAPVLTGVQAIGRLDGVLFELTLRQTYRNPGDQVLEVVYTFPLPFQAVLLGFAAELNGKRKEGAIVAKRQAERRYEEALADGDAPVMLEALRDGLHTANIGNLKPGDEIVLEVRFAQLLAFEQGRLRLAIPTTIAPRYGHAALSGLEPQQVPQASLEAEYPLSLAVTVAGALAGDAVECPTHRFSREVVEGGVRLELAAGAWLDRDVVIDVTPREPRPSLVVRARDAVSPAAPVVVMAALQPPPAALRERIALKLLVDCSGSMGGDSIASARTALRSVLEALNVNDGVSVSRFGTGVEHLQTPTACSPSSLRRIRLLMNTIQADMGGTEMERALQSVFELPAVNEFGTADVLLFTDGEIWQAQTMINAARASGHRVFAIGVGASPAEGVLRSLAEATGGACEFATPGEALEAAARHMLGRIRQQPWQRVRIDWGAETAWQSNLPASVFGGDTVIAFAGMMSSPSVPTVRLLCADVNGTVRELARGEADVPCRGDTLSRMAAARRIATAGPPEALALAVDYQLMSKQTNCILVHERADADRAVGSPTLHPVESMLAAGWGATAAAAGAASMSYGSLGDDLASHRVHRNVVMRSASADPFASLLRRSAAPLPARDPVFDLDQPPLRTMALAVVRHLTQGGHVEGLAAYCDAMSLHADVLGAIESTAKVGATRGEAWLLLAHWTNTRGKGLASAAATATLLLHIDDLDKSMRDLCLKIFDDALGDYDLDGWKVSRARRLRRALSCAKP